MADEDGIRCFMGGSRDLQLFKIYEAVGGGGGAASSNIEQVAGVDVGTVGAVTSAFLPTGARVNTVTGHFYTGYQPLNMSEDGALWTSIAANGNAVTSSNPFPVINGISASNPGYFKLRTTALTNVAQTCKNAAGNLLGFTFININTVAVYIKFYDQPVGTVTVGTSTVVHVIPVPAGTATNPGVAMVTPAGASQQYFSSTIQAACVTGLADADATAPVPAIYAETFSA